MIRNCVIPEKSPFLVGFACERLFTKGMSLLRCFCFFPMSSTARTISLLIASLRGKSMFRLHGMTGHSIVSLCQYTRICKPQRVAMNILKHDGKTYRQRLPSVSDGRSSHLTPPRTPNIYLPIYPKSTLPTVALPAPLTALAGHTDAW